MPGSSGNLLALVAHGRQIEACFNDELHPSEAGYRVWRDQLVPFLARARADRKSTGEPAGRYP